MINKVILVGRAGKDPEVRHFDEGKTVARFSLATGESYRDKDGNLQEQTEWHTITCWRELARSAESYVRKGRLLYVEGRLRTRKYTDSNGVEKYTTEIEANSIRYLDKMEQSSGANYQPISTPQDAGAAEPNGGDDMPF